MTSLRPQALKGGSLRGRLTRTLVGLGIVSVVLLAAVNFVVVRGLLSESTRAQLQTTRDVRADGVNLAFDRLLERTAVFGFDPTVAEAIVALDAGYESLDDEPDLTDDQLDELRALYEPVVAPYDEVGAPRPTIDELLPTNTAGQLVQYEYLVRNDEEVRADLVDAGDGSDYSVAHAEYHEYLRGLAESIGATDLLLVSSRTYDVVYSVSKEVDLGTNLFNGPYSEVGPGDAVLRLLDVGADESVFTDTQFYLPNSSAPVVHAAISVRAGTELVGALVLRVPTNQTTALVNANGDWDLLGLGDSGDAYIVGSDGLLRTLPRPYIDDPEGYVERFASVTGDDLGATLIEFTGAPVLIAGVDNSVVNEALGGDPSFGRAKNGLDRSVVAAATPLDVGDLGWVLVTEQSVGESRQELVDFAWSIALLLGVLAVVLLVVGSYLAKRIARPVKPLVGSARDIAAGDYDTDVPELGSNELGDVGRQLSAVASHLRDQDDSIQREEQRIGTMLESVLPAALVERVRAGERELSESVDGATVVAIAVKGIPVSSAAEQDALVELMARMNEAMTDLARSHGIERVKVALERALFVAGRGKASVEADAALEFALDAMELIPSVAAEQGLDVSVRVGVATGLVASGVLGSRQVSFDVWGDPVTRATALARDAAAGQMVADVTVIDSAERSWPARPVGSGEADGTIDAADADGPVVITRSSEPSSRA